MTRLPTGSRRDGHRRFALDNPHLYRAMFGDGLSLLTDDPASMETFFSLLRRIQRCVDDGRLVVDDVHLAGEAVWASVHGHMMIELTGYFESMDRDARRALPRACCSPSGGDQPSTRRFDAGRLAQVAHRAA